VPGQRVTQWKRALTPLCGLAVLGMLITSTVWAAGLPASQAASLASAPIDPFDYSYCGGKPVYPVIGINFATACGPRNQIGLGRRGLLMWLFPPRHAGDSPLRGKRQLTEEELKRLSLLAEVVQIADPPPAAPGAAIYSLGVNFQGRPDKRVHAPMSDAYTPANALFQAMLALVPDAPQLPACDGALRDFEPTLLPAERVAGSAQP
jgi:hypothetical protein